MAKNTTNIAEEFATPKKRGPKPRKITFPTNRDFTLVEIRRRLENLKKPITAAAIATRMKKLVEEGKFKVVGRKKLNGKGQPPLLFRAIKEGVEEVKEVEGVDGTDRVESTEN